MSEYSDNFGAVPIGEEELAELAALRLEKWRDAAVAEFPAARPLRDMLVGNSAEAVKEVAKDVAENLAASGVAVPSVPVTAGSPAIYRFTADDEVGAAKERARRSGDWTEVLNALRRRELERRGLA